MSHAKIDILRPGFLFSLKISFPWIILKMINMRGTLQQLSSKSLHRPLRSCIGCGIKTDKRALLRLVLSPKGHLMFDPRQNQPGRGAYICKRPACLQEAISHRRFPRVFHSSIAQTDYSTLLEQFVDARLQSIRHIRPSLRLALITQLLEDHFGRPPWQGCENPLDTLILTVLSQNTNDRNRDQAFARLRQRYPQWQQVLEAETADIAEAIRPAGLANQKSVRIRDILHWVHLTYGTFNLDFLCREDPEKVKQTFLQRNRH